jgi:peptidyl-prolyl cis-trans isomerase SurA
MTMLRTTALAAMLVSTLLSTSARADRTVMVDRVEAVVGTHTVFHSDVLRRARGREPIAQRELLDRMVDELIIADECEKARISVTSDEIQRALDLVAKSNRLTTDALIKLVIDRGLTVDEYKAELRRQLLDAKWVNLRVRSRVTVDPKSPGTEDEKIAAFAKRLESERAKLLAEIRSRTYVLVYGVDR